MRVPAVFTGRSPMKGQVSRTTPMRSLRRRAVASSACGPNGSPNRITSPASGSINPMRARMVVVLPAPLTPMNPVTQPAGTRRDTSSSTAAPS